MSKIRHHKRIMPKTGRIQAGTFRPSFVDGDEARGNLIKGDSSMVPICRKGEGGLIPKTENSEEWTNTMVLADPDCNRITNPDGNHLRYMPDRIWKSHRHSQQEIISYWAERENNGNVSEFIRAREKAMMVKFQGTWMARDKAFWEGLETDNSERRYSLPKGGSKSNPSTRTRKRADKKHAQRNDKLRADQYRQFGVIAKAAGIDVRKYLAKGGTIQALLKLAKSEA